MSNEFGYLDIILLAMIAGFIILRLRNILGRRTGHQNKVYDSFSEKEFDKLAHGIDEYNAYKFGITESSRLDNLPTAPSSNSYELDILSHSLDLLHNI